jgi:GT2 family glycosyltransferase
LQIIKKEAFQKAGGYNENLVAGEDNDLFHRLSKIGSTYYMNNLTVYHLGRREHALGWLKLISIWLINGISVLVFKRAASKEWRAIR